ncbi:hypothetical protein [Antarctobacter heliothermus]|uniref:Uncharacterized protein n=1 Tax=Antarctobacter heliothermus TaxID=74033 RepID=A0A239IV00_9RHOB|nr:hypothetical protein [Antarctobacter heliothermus]SNS97202.1 hypothetical protein SAMN04488078_10468 [Antarctobacter heliothermus]
MTPPKTDRTRTTTRFFWGTLVALFAVVSIAAVAAFLHKPAPTHLDIPPTRLETALTESVEKARAEVVSDLDTYLDPVYAPAYAAIPRYADFHYSILGEYVELGEAALGQSSEALEQRLLAGFDARLTNAAAGIDATFVQAYRDTVETRIRQEAAPETFDLPLGEMTASAISDAVQRAKVTAPVAAMVALGGKSALKATAKLFAKKLATKVASKAAAKGIAKGGGIAAGAGGGALLCSWLGPGAAICGAAGALVVWLATDAAIIGLDEYFNRDEFEAELRLMLDKDRAAKRLVLENALTRKASAMEDFRLNQLAPAK